MAGGRSISYLAELRGFSRQAKLFLGMEALLMASTGGIFTVLYNLYLSRLGFAEDFIGQFNSLGALGMAICSMPAAFISDRLGFKKAFPISCLGLASLLAMLALSRSGPLLLVLNFAFSALEALFWVNANPFLAMHSLPQERTSLFSFRFTIMQLSAMLGSTCAGLLPQAFTRLLALPSEAAFLPLRYALLVGAGLMAASLVPLAVIKVEPRDRPAASPPPAPTLHQGSPIRGGWVLLVALGMLSGSRGGAQQALNYFFNVYLYKVHALPTAQIGLTYALAQGASCAAILLVCPALVRGLGFRRAMDASLWSTVGFPFLIALVPVAPIAILGYVATMVTLNINKPFFAQLAMEAVPQELRVRTAGASMTGWSATAALVGVVGGYLIIWTGYNSIFFLSGGFALAGVAIYKLYFHRARLPEMSTKGTGIPHPTKGSKSCPRKDHGSG